MLELGCVLDIKVPLFQFLANFCF